ncbi:MAG: S1 RNA-binding domain-containing protein [Bacilli bacterium]|nr:S1 RNA-binding domain-containing protein [Bacilli bacterium]
MADLKTGSIVKGQVTGIEKYGAFVSVDNDYTGLIHISEVSNDFVSDIHNFLEIGEIIYCQILEVDNNHKQLKLSIKNINYKTKSNSKMKESRLGFLPLKNNLEKWINDKLSEINESSSK